eukprot:tig00020944_g16348.t1
MSAAALFAAPLATWDYPVGARGPSLLVVARDLDDNLVVCEWNLEANSVRFMRAIPSLPSWTGPFYSTKTFGYLTDVDPVDFAFTTSTPFPGRDIDVRPARAGDGRFLRSAATWAGQSNGLARLPWPAGGLVGVGGDGIPLYASRCFRVPDTERTERLFFSSGALGAGTIRGCGHWRALNLLSFAFSGCSLCCNATGDPYTENVDWPEQPTATWPGCASDPYNFVSLGRSFSLDERWYRAYAEASLYLSIGAYKLDGKTEELLGGINGIAAFGNLILSTPNAAQAGYDARANTGYLYHTDVNGYATLRRRQSAWGLFKFDTAPLFCRPFFGPAWPDFLSHTAIFSFWQRGIAYFAASYRVHLELDGIPLSNATVVPANAIVVSVNVEPRILLCRFSGAVPLPMRDSLAALAPAGYTADATGVYPGGDPVAFIDRPEFSGYVVLPERIPVGPAVHAMTADGRVEPSGPLAYHAISRTPFFQQECSAARVRGVCPSTVKHVIALWSWSLAGSVAAPRRAPVPIAERSVPLAESCIVQNGHASEAGYGIGALEGKFVEGHGRPFSYYVLGDEIIRLRRPGTFESGIGGEVSGRLRLQPEGWAPSLSEWYSVRAAVYSRGSLFVVRQRHTAEDTDCQQYLSDQEVFTFPENRLRNIVVSSTGPAELLKIENVEGDAMGPVRVAIKDFYQNIGGGYVTDDLGTLESFDYRLPFPESPFIVLYNKQPARVIKIYTNCPAGQTFNAPSVFWDTADPDCMPLPPGLYSNRTGVISADEADVCPEGTFSEEGATSCTVCPAGTYSERGAGSCYDCPQNTYSLTDGAPCTPCPATAFTRTTKWTSECLFCEPGTYLPYTGATVCLACPAQTWASRGTVGSCSYCGQGEVPSADASHCEKCPAGTYQRENRTACILCPDLTYASTPGTFGQCAPCKNGTVSVISRVECQPCLPGYFAYGAECLRCFGNSIAPEAGRSNCTECPRGQVATEDKANCIACPAGTFFTVATGSDVATCEKCPLNTVTSSAGLEACTPCKLGEVAAADSQSCVPCGAGTYRGGNMTACVPAPERSIALQGAQAFIECLAGYVPSPARTECVECPAGSFQKNDTCERCPLHAISSAPGQYMCSPCPRGQVATADSQSCELCQAGTYRADGMLSCAVVPERAIALKGSWNFTYCSPGSVPNLARTDCLVCPAGTYQVRDACERCPLLTVASSAGSTECEPCPLGHVQAEDVQSCVPCTSGTYRDEGLKICTAVPFRAVSLRGAWSYTECAPGWVPDGAKEQCVQCAAGFAQVGEACERCALNSVASQPGQTECRPCEPGWISALDSQTCVPCGTGTYRPAGFKMCTPVPEEAVALQGSEQYTNCTPGWTRNRAKSECTPCSPGTYQQQDACARCPILTISSAPGSTSCAPCRPGTVPADDLQSCVPCGAGTYRAPDMLVCTAVPFRAVALPGSANFTDCSAGWIPDAAKEQCRACPSGSYQVGEICERCPLNTVNGVPGKAACVACAPGYVSSTDSQKCVPCGEGTFRHANSSSCIPVPPRAVAGLGSAMYTNCSGGSVPNAALSECIVCPAGTYQVNDECRRCPLLKVSSQPGSTECTLCRPGTVPAENLQTCKECRAGFYRQADQLKCTVAPRGAVALRGSENYTVCLPGTIPDSAKAQCVQCPAGSYQVDESCEPCPLNHVASLPGQTKCTECSPGTVSSTDSQLCLPCEAGTYRSASMSVCRIVPARSVAPLGSPAYIGCASGWVPDQQRSACIPCPAGTAQRRDACEECPVNTHTSRPGLSSCSACPAGTVSAADSQSCIPCPSGTFRNGTMIACRVVPDGTVAMQASALYTVCPRGTVPNAPGDECIPCGKGNIEVDRSCRTCAGNTYNPLDAASECIECEPGTFPSADRQRCDACLPGTYRAAGMPSCAACPWGTYSVGGAPVCKACAPGTISTADRSSCEPCPSGTY